MKKITRGGIKNGPVYQATPDELEAANRVLSMNPIQRISEEIRSAKPANQTQYKPDNLNLSGSKLPNRKWFINEKGLWYSLPRESVCFLYEK